MATATVYAGIDIGKETIHVATGYTRRDKVTQISLKDPEWHVKLCQIVPPRSIAVLEPSGWYYAAPIVNCLFEHDVETHLIQGSVTGAIREAKIAGIKTDSTDARALAYAAKHIDEMRGTHPINPEDLSDALALRALIRAYDRAEREATRATNRLHQICHSVAPAFSTHLETYMRAVEIGIIQPKDIRSAAQKISEGETIPNLNHRTTKEKLHQLAASIPHWIEETSMAEIIISEATARYTHMQRKEELAMLINEMIHRPTFRRLTELWRTIPYAGIMDIAKIHAATYGNAHLMTLHQMKANCGSYPEIKASGKTDARRATKRGFRPAKTALFLWIRRMQMAKLDNPITYAFNRAKERHSKQATAIARAKLIEILWVIARDGKPFYNPRQEAHQAGDES